MTVSGTETGAPPVTLLELPRGSTVFVDTNILLYTLASESAFHTLARHRVQALQEAGAVFWTNRQVLRELLAAATRPGLLQDPNPVDRWLTAAGYL